MYPYFTIFKHKLTMIDTYIFIGMAGVGKSSIGASVAKHFKLKFYDIDNVLVDKYQQPLNELILAKGVETFKKIESDAVLDLVGNNNIIAPGGSFIYSDDVIQKIKSRSLFVLLYDNPINIKKRISNLNSRGIIGMEKNVSFEDVFYERERLYHDVGNIRFNLEFQSFKSACQNVINYFELII